MAFQGQTLKVNKNNSQLKKEKGKKKTEILENWKSNFAILKKATRQRMRKYKIQNINLNSTISICHTTQNV